MRRLTCAVGAIAMLTALGPGTALPALGHHEDDGPDQIRLPDGWQPEGVTTDGRFLYAGSLADGAIWKASAKTGEGELLARGHEGRVAVGLDYDDRRDLLWVAGGDTNVVRAQDADSGKVLARYRFPSATPRFLNDLVVTDRAVYVTDSMNQELGVIPFWGKHRHGHDNGGAARGHGHGDGSALPPQWVARTVPLTGDLVYQDGFNLNGIAAAHHLLIAVQSNTGLLFRINPWSGTTKEVDLGDETVVNGDGLELRHGKAYVVQNLDNTIAVVDLRRHARSGEIVAILTDRDLDVPATAAFARGSLWAANARFTTPPTPTTTYTIVRVDLKDDRHATR
jgi:hypothetical protein